MNKKCLQYGRLGVYFIQFDELFSRTLFTISSHNRFLVLTWCIEKIWIIEDMSNSTRLCSQIIVAVLQTIQIDRLCMISPKKAVCSLANVEESKASISRYISDETKNHDIISYDSCAKIWCYGLKRLKSICRLLIWLQIQITCSRCVVRSIHSLYARWRKKNQTRERTSILPFIVLVLRRSIFFCHCRC